MQEAAQKALVQRQMQLVARSSAAAAASAAAATGRDYGEASPLLSAMEGLSAGGGGSGGAEGVAAGLWGAGGAWEAVKVAEGFGLEVSSRLKWRQTQTHGGWVSGRAGVILVRLGRMLRTVGSSHS